MKREFIYTSIFEKKTKNFSFSKLHELELENLLLKNPKIGEVIKGAGGIRKARFSPSKSKQGKSGSYRVFYIDLEEVHLIIFITMISKKEKDNIDDEEKKILKQKVETLKSFYSI